MKRKFIYSLDLGTTKFCLAQIALCPHKKEFDINIVSLPSKGVKVGMLSDINEANIALNDLVALAESNWKTDIERVTVGIAGNHLDITENKSDLEIFGQKITDLHLNELEKKISDQIRFIGKEPLHILVDYYKIDDRQQISNPLEFTGQFLQGNYKVFSSNKLYLRDIVLMCNQSGLIVENIHSEGFASALSCLSPAQMENGIAIADIGGGTTDIIVFQKGKPSLAKTINIGGHLMTKDIAIGLNLNFEEAEKLKIFWGLNQNNDHPLVVKDIYEKEKSIRFSDTFPILVPRVYELAEAINQQLKPFKGKLNAGIVLTGGGSEIFGIVKFFEQLFNIPIVCVKPTFIPKYHKNYLTNIKSDFKKGQYATVNGLLMMEIDSYLSNRQKKTNLFSKRYLNHFIDWLKELS